MINKLFRLDEEELKIINEVQGLYQFSSEAETVRYIIRQYKKQMENKNKVYLAVLRGIEEKVDILYDIANTDLIQRKEDTLYPVDLVESPVIQKARELRRQKLAHKKQRSDFKKKKQ